MKFLTKKSKGNSVMKPYKHGFKFWRRVVSVAFCVILFGSNAVGTLAAEVPITETESQSAAGMEDMPPAEEPTPAADEGTDQSKNEEALDAQITAWTWVDEEEFLTEYNEAWYLGLPGLDMQQYTSEELQEILTEMLPKQISAVLSDSAGQSDGETLVDITWDFSVLSEEPQVIENSESDPQTVYLLQAVLPEGCSLAENVAPLEVRLDAGGAELYANYPGTRRALNDNDKLTDHTVQGITPAGTTVNLFDYDPEIGSNGNDVLPNGTDASFTKNSKGINKDALLLFGGSAMREAGFWNQGSGAGRPWGKANVNMKGIVKSTLKDGYPYINLDDARSMLPNATTNTKPTDIANLEHAEYENAGISKARALSKKLLESRGLTVSGEDGKETVSGSCEKASLSYLFDPNKKAEGKTTYTDVDNLFQIDNDGYYYYDARKNYAEYNKGSNSFTLYDGPAVWRTDAGWNGSGFNGDMSLGNFFPFDSASKVFDSIQTKDKDEKETNILSSSTNITNVNNAVKANHYMGMTMEVEFTQPESGRLNMGSNGKQPMVFQFSGDDDVWVFIDDVLVLDLGGVHSELYGTIDFSTGEVITGQSWRTGGLPDNPGNVENDEKTTLYEMFEKAGVNGNTSWADSGKNKIFRTGTTHTLKMFYLERGNYDSSLQLRFNLQPALAHSIKKVDQNGDPLKGVTFDLYEAERKTDVEDGTAAAADVDSYQVKNETPIATLTTDEDGKAEFTRSDSTSADGSPFSFADRYIANGTQYYILKETQTAGGYRSLPKDIVLRFDPDNSMLIVVNRYQTGAYASFFSNISETGKLTYGQFDENSGVIASSSEELSNDCKKNGLIVAVPMLLEENMSHDDTPSDGKWQALYGSNTEGYGAVAPTARKAEEWRKAVLKAALYQASDERWPEWRLTYDENTGRLKGLLEDLPGRSDRYALNNPNGDMKMVYGIIQPKALKSLGIEGNTSEELYNALEAYVSGEVKKGAADGKTTDEVINAIVEKLQITGEFNERDFSFLNTDQFQREFRSTIYIPNERRELRVQKVDQDGKGVNGVEFTLTGPDGSTVTGTTATVDGQDGMLIFRPNQDAKDGYAQVTWEEAGAEYTLKETVAPSGYELNTTEIPVIVGIYSIYADAGTAGDGVTVMAGVGKLMQTMTKYAADDIVNITLRDITATAQTQKSGSFNMNGWEDDLLAGTDIPRSMNLHYGMNAVVDYGLHDEDGGKNIYPFFTTDEGFLRTRVEQNTSALKDTNMYHNSNNTANWDNLEGRDLTSLFSLLNTVVVTDQKTPADDTGKLRISKVVSGDSVGKEDYINNFTFNVSLKDANGNALTDSYYYYGEQRAGYISDGGTLSLRHDEALTVLGLPAGTLWEISEVKENGWSVRPASGMISGEITKDNTAYAAFTNYKGELKSGKLTVSKTVAGSAGDKQKEFHFTVTLSDKAVSGTYGDMTFGNGVASFTLKDSESKTATGLPVGIAYEVTETEADQDGYTTISTGESGTIVEAGAAAAFTNTKGDTPTKPEKPEKPGKPGKSEKPETSVNKIPKTGDENNLFLWLVIMGISVFVLVTALVAAKRRNKRNK